MFSRLVYIPVSNVYICIYLAQNYRIASLEHHNKQQDAGNYDSTLLPLYFLS